MIKPYETETREKDGIEYTIKHYADTGFCDLSHLGEFSNQPKAGWYVDRSTGQLLGDMLPEPVYEGNEECEDEAFWKTWDEWSDNPEEILSEYLSTWDRPGHEYRYFIPDNHQGMVDSYAKDPDMIEHYNEHVKPKLDGFDIALPTEMTPEALGKAASALYACQNYQRVVTYGSDWWYVYIEVSINHAGEEVATSGLSTESDSDQKYVDSLIDDLMAESRSDLAKQAEHYDELAAWIRTLDAEKEEV